MRHVRRMLPAFIEATTPPSPCACSALLGASVFTLDWRPSVLRSLVTVTATGGAAISQADPWVFVALVTVDGLTASFQHLRRH